MPLLRFFSSLILTCGAVSAANGAVEHIEITSRSDVLGGKEFGTAGAYERLIGKVHFSVDVANPRNHSIVDLENAENLKDGKVAFSADFIAVQPQDPRKANGSMILESPNRGRGRIVGLVDGGDWDLAHDAGDAWLLRNGYRIVTLGWQWDAVGDAALRLQAPIAKDHGKTITGLLRGDLMLAAATDEIPLGHLITGTIGGSEYPVDAPDDPRNVLTVRDTRDAKRTVIPRTQWQFAHTIDGKLVADNRNIHLDGGFRAGKIYEYVYVVADPVVAGLGFAAFRDFASYAKHAHDSQFPATQVIGQGISQNGRFLRDLIYQGFNADEDGRTALDGVLAHVAGAGRGNFNYRFAQPSRDAQPTSAIDFATDIFPFTDVSETDPLTGARGGLLDRARTDRVVPKIFLSNTSYEYWGRAASLISTSADGQYDIQPSPNVRIYHFTGLQHFSVPFPPKHGEGDLLGQEPQSPLPVRYFWRAMIANMRAWLHDNTAPPPSSYPKIADHTLVSLSEYAFPTLHGVHLPHEASNADRLDFGPDWSKGIVGNQPPEVGKPYPVLVPQVDADGNERDGVRLPEITVPLATYTGWNLRDATIGAPGERVAFEGSYIAFAKTAAERETAHDPRRSIAERYASRDDYLTRYSTAVDALVAQRWLLDEDRPALLKRGQEEWAAATR